MLDQPGVRDQIAAIETRVNPAYADYANPMTSWLMGLLSWVDGDTSNGNLTLSDPANAGHWDLGLRSGDGE